MLSREFFEKLDVGDEWNGAFSLTGEEIRGIALNDSTPIGLFVSTMGEKNRYLVMSIKGAKIAVKATKNGDTFSGECFELGAEDVDYGTLELAQEEDDVPEIKDGVSISMS